jgi:hypothetical protein
MEEHDYFLDVSPAFHTIGEMLRETGWRALYIILFFIAGEIFFTLGSVQLSPYPQFRSLIELGRLSNRLIFAMYGSIFIVVGTFADIGLGLWHYVRELEKQNEAYRARLRKASSRTGQTPKSAKDEAPIVIPVADELQQAAAEKPRQESHK